MIRKLQYTNWGIDLLEYCSEMDFYRGIGGIRVAKIEYPIGPQGPCGDYKNSQYHRFAEHWENGHDLSLLQKEYPYVHLS